MKNEFNISREIIGFPPNAHVIYYATTEGFSNKYFEGRDSLYHAKEFAAKNGFKTLIVELNFRRHREYDLTKRGGYRPASPNNL